MRQNKDTFHKILKQVRPYRHILLLSLVFAVISVALTLYAPILVGDALDKIIGVGKVDFDAIFHILKKLGLIIAVTGIAQWCMNLCNNTIVYRVVKDVRMKAFSHLQKLPLKYIDSHSNGETLSRIITDVEQFSDGLLMGFSQLFTGVVTIVGTLFFKIGRAHV